LVDEDGAISEERIASLEKHALLNAIHHSGKADVGAVISKVMGDFPELRSRAKLIIGIAQEMVVKVNALSVEDQERLLKEKYPESMVEQQRKEGRVGLPPLPDVEGKVVLRLPPEPSGFMHIGHAMAGVINFTYKEIYKGELWLRFEDTNPRKVAKRYYESFREGYRWLGINWDEEKNVSDDLEIIYDHGKKLLKSGSAYACACKADTVKKLRFDGKSCDHREQSVEKNLSIWESILAKRFKEGEYVIRLKGDIGSLDYSLRDPNIFRIIQHEHPVTRDRFIVWPTYDFAVVVEDEICRVTHILRSAEFHSALQDTIRKLLSFLPVHIHQFSRFNFRGTPVQKRLLRPLVEKRLVSGWDDPRMPTIEAIRRRGILGETIKQFTLQVGYTKSEHEYDWSLLFSINRKLLDPKVKRFFFVPNPVKLTVSGAANRSVTLPFHPEKYLGMRKIDTSNAFYVPRDDIEKMKVGQTFRLMELYNVELTSKKDFEARFIGDELIKDTVRLQWVTTKKIEIKVIEPYQLFNDDGTYNTDSIKITMGYAESAFSEAHMDEIVQFPRYGFCRVDEDGVCILVHK
jgi:glutamyl-tRNA synthetase